MPVISSMQLEEMRQIDIVDVDPCTLVDASTISLDQRLPQREKIEQFVGQLGNPYCFISGDTPVRVRFVRPERELLQPLTEYFSRLKRK